MQKLPAGLSFVLTFTAALDKIIRARRASDPTAVLPVPTRRKDRPSKLDGLTKQTYSVTVHLPGSSESRKWHLVAYFSVWCNNLFALMSQAYTGGIRVLKGNDYNRLPVVENYDYLRNIHVPHGVFLNSKVMSMRPDRSSYLSDESEVYDDHPQPSKAPFHDYSRSPSSPISYTSPSTPYMTAASPRQHHSLPASFSRGENQAILLPPINSFTGAACRPSLPHSHSGGIGGPTKYKPLSSEDRRVLDSFRIAL